jgi:hypothetical protein
MSLDALWSLRCSRFRKISGFGAQRLPVMTDLTASARNFPDNLNAKFTLHLFISTVSVCKPMIARG